MREITTGLKHASVMVEKCTRKCRALRMLALSPFYVEPFVCFRPTIATAYTSLMERLFYHIIGGVPTPPSNPDFGLVFSKLKRVWALARKQLPVVASWSFQQFVESYSGRKRGVYERALKRVLEARITSGRIRKWASVRAFIKHEKLPDSMPAKRVVPRMISPRSPEYNILLGSYVRPMEHSIYSCWQRLFKSPDPVVAKGINSVELGAIVDRAFDRISRHGTPVVIGLDMSRFDQHIRSGCLKYEHLWYKRMGGNCRWLRALLAEQLESRGIVLCDDGVLRYKCDGTRCSGDMNTACGNVVIMLSLVLAYLLEHDIPLCEVAVLDNGDDMSVITTSRHATDLTNGLPKFVASLGFVLKMEPPVHEKEHISFCQLMPINRGDQYVMVREWPRAASKDAVTVHSCRNLDYYLRYLHDIGEAGMKMCAGIPVLGAYYEMLSRAHQSGVPNDDVGDLGIRQWTRGLSFVCMPVADVARVSFYRATGCTPYHQTVLEERYRTMNLSEARWEVLETAVAAPSSLLPTGGHKW